MKIGVVKEIKADEYRVALTPAGARELVRRGHDVLVETGAETAGQGSCSSLVPPAENIHRVANAGAERAISIHVYGADIERLGSSINKTFDHLPVRELDGATRQAWRGR